MNSVILIPCLNPNEKMVKLVKDLKEAKFDKIVIVNDGSAKEYNKYFDECYSLGCTILVHEKNKGKGEGIKTGIRFINKNLRSYNGVITVDADGQHLPVDACKISKEMDNNISDVILGVRNFSEKQVPFRSRWGNRISSLMFKLTTGVRCPDTQTGLRGIPKEYYDIALGIKGSRYDYEMDFLNEVVSKKIKLSFVSITTVYEDNNSCSHFRPVRDSILIYKKPLKYACSSLLSCGVDIGMFALFTAILNSEKYELIFMSTILARIISGVFNFILNKKWSFKSSGKATTELFKYFILFVSIMLLSSLGVSFFSSLLKASPTLVKVFVDALLFIISYTVQKKYIFKG